MRRIRTKLYWLTVLLLVTSCMGPQGPHGPPGPQGPQGETGATGSFSGTTNSSVQFDGPVAINGALTIAGKDLFAASMEGLAPAVFGYGNGGEHLICGAPNTINIGTTVTYNSATYGETIYTTRGAFNLSQYVGPGYTPCANLCIGPLTFFLNSPSAQTIVLQGNFDDGPSKIYLDGAAVATTSGATPFNQGIDIPAGPFAISLVACSSNGFSITFMLTNQWISAYNLSIDIDRTFHRNGK